MYTQEQKHMLNENIFLLTQCQFGIGTATVGIPRSFNALHNGPNSSAPVKNPGTITAAHTFSY